MTIAPHFYTLTPSPLGDLVLTSDGVSLTGLYTPYHRLYAASQKGIRQEAPFKDALQQLDEYFAGRRQIFDLPLSPGGTAFQQRVWQALLHIPHGETRSYGQLAASIHAPRSARAVGLANSKNPLSIFIPCHRVIGTNRKLTGYAGGIETKQYLLQHESAIRQVQCITRGSNHES